MTTKRVFSSTNGAADLAFFTRYIGVADPSATFDPGCLYRDLGWSLPDHFGIHFPQSFVTADRPPPPPPSADGTNNGAKAKAKAKVKSLRDWELARLAEHDAAASPLAGYATSFFVPDLGPHVAAFEAEAVPFVARRTTAAAGGDAAWWSVTVRTPASGQAMELLSGACSGCAAPSFPPFGAGECAAAHALPRPLSYYAAAWAGAAAAKGGWANITRTTASGANASLPAPLVAQVRVAVADAQRDGAAFLAAFLPGMLANASASASASASAPEECTCVRAHTGTAPFDGPPVFFGYELEYVFVQNDAADAAAAAAGAPTWAGYQAWMDQLHAAYVGFGVGYDRGLDFHVKIMDNSSLSSATRPGVSLDAWAALHEAHGVRYHAFNVSNPCPSLASDDDEGGGPPFDPGVAMIYSAGPGGVQGIEFWGALDATHFGAHELFGWNGCSATMGCETGAPAPMCSTSSGAAGDVTLRARAFHDPLTELATLTLTCPSSAGAISNVTFASFGTPSGDCGSNGFANNASCAAPNSYPVVKAACLGKRSCVVPLRAASFGADPCPGSEKWLAVEATCSE